MHVRKRRGFSGFARLPEELARSSPVLSNTRELHWRTSVVVRPSLGTMHHEHLLQVFGLSEFRRQQEALLMPAPRKVHFPSEPGPQDSALSKMVKSVSEDTEGN